MVWRLAKIARPIRRPFRSGTPVRDHPFMLRAGRDCAFPAWASPGLADSHARGGRGGGIGGALGIVEDAGSRPARVRHAHPVGAPALCVRGPDGATVSDLRHDDGLCLVRAGPDRSVVAHNPAGCAFAAFSIPLISWLLACAVRAEPVGFRSLSGPVMGLLLAACVLCLATWLIRWTVSPTALTAAGP